MHRRPLRLFALRRTLFAVALLAGTLALAQELVVPNPNLELSGIPPIPAALAAKTALYTEFRPRSLAAWHPVKRELVVATRATNTVAALRREVPARSAGPAHRLCGAGAPGNVVAGEARRAGVHARCGRQRATATLSARSSAPRSRCCSPTPAGSTPRRRSIALATGCSSLRPTSTRPAVRARTRRSISRSSIRWRPTRRRRSPRCPAPAGATSRSRSTTGGSRWSSSSRSPRATSG